MALIHKNSQGDALSVIHINVPRAIKARWVKESQTQGIKLTDWIIKTLEITVYNQQINNAINQHGAQKVWGLCIKHMAGNTVENLYLVGLIPQTLADVVRIQRAAYERMGPAQKVIVDADNSAALDILAGDK